MDWDWLARYLKLNNEHINVSMWKKHIKGDKDSAASSEV